LLSQELHATCVCGKLIAQTTTAGAFKEKVQAHMTGADVAGGNSEKDKASPPAAGASDDKAGDAGASATGKAGEGAASAAGARYVVPSACKERCRLWQSHEPNMNINDKLKSLCIALGASVAGGCRRLHVAFSCQFLACLLRRPAWCAEAHMMMSQLLLLITLQATRTLTSTTLTSPGPW
jgi:hypothetical protein